MPFKECLYIFHGTKAKYTRFDDLEKKTIGNDVLFCFFRSTAKHLIAASSIKFIHERYFELIASNFVMV